MPREQVARHQRARLYGAMIESVAQRGYTNTTVAHVIGLAGVSRRAFYEQFSNKEACFLATYDIVIARARKVVIEAWQSERGWANRLHAACRALLDDVAAFPKGPRLVLVDALGTGPEARQRMQLAGYTFERLVELAFASAPDRLEPAQLTPRAVVGGIRHVLFMRLLEGREHELYALTDEFLDWTESYRSPLAARLALTGATAPELAAPAPAEFLLRADGRARVLGAVVHLTLDEGYAQLTDPQIAEFAGISTESFHKQFASKEECFLALLDEFVAEALDYVRTRIGQAVSWPEAVQLGIDAFVEYIVTHEALIRMAFIDLFEVGPGMVGQMTKSVEEFTKLLTEDGPPVRRGPALAQEAITGALWGIVSSYAINDRLSHLPCLSEQLRFFVLAPYIGAREALQSIEAARPGRRRG
jgi:AcrR family transcriptional regulator